MNLASDIARIVGAVVRSVRVRGGFVPAFARAARNVRREGWPAQIDKVLALAGRSGPRSAERQAQRYQAWIRQQARADSAAARQIERELAEWVDAPVVTIVLSVAGVPPTLARRAIGSVRAQRYPHWELIVVAPEPAEAGMDAALRALPGNDQRIRVAAAAAAKGTHVAFVAGGDVLHPMALYWVAREFSDHPGTGLVYTDEDQLDDAGHRSDPYFKGEANYELLLSHDMVSRLAVFARRLPLSGGDHDRSLRAFEALAPDQIRHVPRVLYHRRSLGSPGGDGVDPDRAFATSRRAVAAHFARVGVLAEIVPVPEAPALSRVRFPLAGVEPTVEIVIPTKDRADLLQACVRSIRERTSYRNYRICIVDNGSQARETLELLDRWRADPMFRILADDSPFNFSVLNNRAVAGSAAELVCLVNNDIVVSSRDWLAEMVSQAVRPGVGCVGARLWYPDDKLQHGGVVLGVGGAASHAHPGLPKGAPGYFGRAVVLQEVSAVTAACLLVRKAVFEEVGGFDERLAVAFNDVDLCLRVRKAGYRNIWTPVAELYHHESRSRGYEDSPEKLARLREELRYLESRWGDLLTADPWYSPHLSTLEADFTIGRGRGRSR